MLLRTDSLWESDASWSNHVWHWNRKEPISTQLFFTCARRCSWCLQQILHFIAPDTGSITNQGNWIWNCSSFLFSPRFLDSSSAPFTDALMSSSASLSTLESVYRSVQLSFVYSEWPTPSFEVTMPSLGADERTSFLLLGLIILLPLSFSQLVSDVWADFACFGTDSETEISVIATSRLAWVRPVSVTASLCASCPGTNVTESRFNNGSLATTSAIVQWILTSTLTSIWRHKCLYKLKI